MKNVREILEIDRIVDAIRKYIKTPVGSKKLDSISFLHNKNKIVFELNKLNELMDIISKYGNLPIQSTLDSEYEIHKALSGKVFDESKLNQLKDEIMSASQLNKFVSLHKIETKYLTELFYLRPASHIVNEISRCISLENTVNDNASTLLSDIRKKKNGLNKELKKIGNSLVSRYKDYLTYEMVVIKNGHYALPINTSKKNSISGIVLDISDSGQTTFIEPSEVLEIENKLMLLDLQERDEISRILKYLTDMIMDSRDLLIENNKKIGELDFISSKAQYAFEIDGIIPEILNKKNINLYGARHPLLNKDIVVANDFILGDDKRLMLISGPNAGGKTIALKTVATLIYMTNMGLAIPALNNSSLGIFNNIYLDIGDSQSIEANLSTFSGHISNLSVIFKYLTSADIVLIDEIGNGTDPKEGEALSIAVAKFLITKKCLALLTSHFSLLKKFGLSNPNVLNASFVFDEKNIKPTFKMLLGVSGKSYGFLIAKKYGINQDIINDARSIYQKNYLTKQDIDLRTIEKKENELSFKEERLKEREEKLLKQKQELVDKQNKLKEREDKIKERKLADFDEYLDKMYDNVNNIYEEFKKNKDLKKAESQLLELSKKETKKETLNVGDYVEIVGMNTKGKIVRINNKKISINTDSGFLINTTVDRLKKVGKPAEEVKSTVDIDKEIINKKIVSSQLNLIGFRVNEALDSLDYYLSNCLASGMKNVKIIHGFGTGRLREAIHAHLKTIDYVESFRLGNELDGGSGSTIVTLK